MIKGSHLTGVAIELDGVVDIFCWYPKRDGVCNPVPNDFYDARTKRIRNVHEITCLFYSLSVRERGFKLPKFFRARSLVSIQNR